MAGIDDLLPRERTPADYLRLVGDPRLGQEGLRTLAASPYSFVREAVARCRAGAGAGEQRMSGRVVVVVIQVAVCGPADCTDLEAAQARRVGELLAERGAVVVCGGGTGVMAAVAGGVRSRDGLVIGVWPGDSREGACAGLSAVVVTGMGEARNAILVRSADAVIVVGGSWGTLSEVALAMRRGGVPVVALGGWRVVDADGTPVPGVRHVDGPEEAVAAAVAP